MIQGADGCSAGWVVIGKDTATGALSWRLCANAAALLQRRPFAQVTAIDIPIGLPDSGPRACDQAARRVLSPLRHSSVFSAPIRPVLAAASYAHACRLRFKIEAKKISQQAWNIVPKIKDVDTVLQADPRLQRRVREVHPEVSFARLAGGPLAHSKKTAAGQAERLALLRPFFGRYVDLALADRRELRAQVDDVLDAFVVLWTAERIASGQAERLPPHPETDRMGLRMEIVV